MPRNPKETLQVTNKSGINNFDGNFFASIDENPGVAIDKNLAQNISLALLAQNKVDRALQTGNNSEFLKIVAMLNCRQTTFAVRNITSLRSLVETSKKLHLPDQHPQERLDTMEKMIGVPEMMEDINRILKSGRPPIIGTLEDTEIRTFLETHPNDLPAVVHIFSIRPGNSEKIRSGLVNGQGPSSFEEYEEDIMRNHTFLVLGKDSSGRYVCFHKQGPEIKDRFEISELDSVLSESVVSSESYLSFIGPIDQLVKGHESV